MEFPSFLFLFTMFLPFLIHTVVLFSLNKWRYKYEMDTHSINKKMMHYPIL